MRYGYYVNRGKDEIERVLETRVATMFSHFSSISEDYAEFAEEVLRVAT